MKDNSEQKFIEFFKPLRSIKPRESLLSNILANTSVTSGQVSRLYTWKNWSFLKFSVMSMATVLIVVGLKVTMTDNSPKNQVMALDMESNEISDMINKLEVSPSYEIEIINNE
ncbi:MAG: hypothetical protein AAB590_00375 [Patescibacteria group bacterium]